jgi:type IV pilus assembly protein PilC
MGQKLSQIYYNLSLLLEGGVPIRRSLQTILPPLKGRLKKTFQGILDSISQGESISEAITRYPKVFAPLDIAVLKAADTSGNLDQTFKMLSEWYEFRAQLKRTTTAGLVYPLVILHIAAFAPPFVFFIGAQISLSQFWLSVISMLSIFYIPGLIIYIVFALTPRRGFLRRVLDKALQIIPLLRKALLYLALSRYCRSFYMLYSAGVPITKCAEISTETTGNTAVMELVKGGIDCTLAGKPISEGFSKNLPNEFLSLWQIGEESGEMGKVTKKMAEFTSDKAEFMLKEIIKWIPRLVYYAVIALILFQILRLMTTIRGAYSFPF